MERAVLAERGDGDRADLDRAFMNSGFLEAKTPTTEAAASAELVGRASPGVIGTPGSRASGSRIELAPMLAMSTVTVNGPPHEAAGEAYPEIVELGQRRPEHAVRHQLPGLPGFPTRRGPAGDGRDHSGASAEIPMETPITSLPAEQSVGSRRPARSRTGRRNLVFIVDPPGGENSGCFPAAARFRVSG